MGKIKPDKGTTKKETKMSFLHWTIFTLIYIIFLMWLSGMGQHYFPEPIHVGVGQYFDLSTGVLILGISIYITIATVIFKKIKLK